ncbi:MAG TPA: Fe-S cluster assembly protein SufD [Bauldia sp.]|nr:Fe-S cluster assembly protein SufD [Bauldia sp.]
MNAEPRTLHTRAEDELAAMFRSERGRLPGGAGIWREQAFARFDRAGLPHRRVEAWKYTDLRALLRSVPPLSGEASRTQLGAFLRADRLHGVERARIVVVNGLFRPDLSDLSEVDGVEAESLADLIARDPHAVGRLFGDNADAVLALNAALLEGGVVVTVARDANPALPIEIAHVAAVDQPAAIFQRDIVSIGENASARFIDTCFGPPEIAYQRNAATELDLAAGARIVWARLQEEGDEAVHLASFGARLGRDAALDHVAVSSGAGLSRWQGFIRIEGQGARAGFFGATMLSGGQHADLALVVHHASEHTQSRELFKNVADGEAVGAFQGRIVVEAGAQKTDAKMMTQALILSDSAQFAQKPELEIFADDVQCGHGATAGQIDETMLFYLMARGIPRAEAEQLLIEAFLADAIDAVGEGAIAAAMRGVVAAWLAKRRPA